MDRPKPLPPSPQPNPSPWPEKLIETIIFASRWLMAPIYLGLIAALAFLVVIFLRELARELPLVMTMDEAELLLFVLTLIDLSLAGNLVLIILFSGYENFISKIDHARDDRDRPAWMGKLDFSAIKIMMISSIAAISCIHLLKIFMNLHEYAPERLRWYVIIHAAFLVSGVAFAAMDWIEEKAHALAKKD